MLLDIIVVNTGMVRQTLKPSDDNIIELLGGMSRTPPKTAVETSFPSEITAFLPCRP